MPTTRHHDAARGDAPPIDDALLGVVRCPVTKQPLRRDGDWLVTDAGTRYPVVDGLAVLVPGRQPPEATDSGATC